MIGGLEYEDNGYLRYARNGANVMALTIPVWAGLVNVARLDVSRESQGVLAHVFGAHTTGLQTIDARMGRKIDPAHCGFTVFRGQWGDPVAWERLRAAWLRIFAELGTCGMQPSKEYGFGVFLALDGRPHKVLASDAWCFTCGGGRHDVIV